jgi:cytochrome c biogenesis protein
MRTPLLTDELLRGLSFSATVKKDLPPDAVKAKVIHVLKRQFASPQETVQEETLHLFCEKSKYARLGVYIIHLSVLVILLGGVLGSLFGFRGNLIIAEGHRSREVVLQSNSTVHELDFDVRCDAFEVTYYPNGAPKDYKSTLTILEGDTPKLSKVIEVNHPLGYKGLTFYQSTWGTLSEVLLAVKPKGDKTPATEFRVEEGGSFTIPGTGLTVKLNRFFTDFIIEEGRPINRSAAPNNPAAELRIYEKGQLRDRAWVFKNFPGFHGSRDLEYEFTIKGFDQKKYTGLQVTRDPGVPVVWVGCTLMMLGILFTFFLSHRKVWVRIRPAGQETELVLAGSPSKNRLGFEKEFERLRQEMEKIN